MKGQKKHGVFNNLILGISNMKSKVLNFILLCFKVGDSRACLFAYELLQKKEEINAAVDSIN